MKILMSDFFSGMGTGYIFHTETGCSLMDDPYACKYLFVQSIPGKLQGSLEEKDYQELINANLKLGEFKTVFIGKIPCLQGGKVDRNYFIRNIQLSDDTIKKLETIIQYFNFNVNEKPLILTVSDKNWVKEIISQFPEYPLGRLKSLEENLKPFN